MARARNIKPSIMDNEELAVLPALTRLLFIYMWMLADREGRIEDRPARIKKQALGYDNGSADEMLSELARAGFIERYEVDGFKVIQILAFNKHQTPHIREAASELPASTSQGKDEHQPRQVQEQDKTRDDTHLGKVEHSPRSPDSGFSDSGFSDSGFSDSGFSDCGEGTRARPPEPPPDPPKQPSQAGLACMAMRTEGIAQVNPAHPELVALLDQGATIETFRHAARECRSAGKLSFAYVLGKVRGQMTEAAQILHTPMAQMPAQTGETAYQRARRERAEALSPSVAKKAPTGPIPEVFEMEASNVIALAKSR